MPHLHTKPGQVDFTASAYIYLVSHELPKILFVKHLRLNVYMQPGGHVEHNENAWQAIVRELREEAGYDIDQLQILQPKLRLRDMGSLLNPYPLTIITHKYPKTDHYHTDISFAFITSQTPRHQPFEGESTDLIWLTQKEMNALAEKKTFKNVRQIANFGFDELLKAWEPVDTIDFNLTP